MCQSKDFNNLFLQISIFTPFLNFATNTVFAELMKKHSSVFDGDTMSLPLSKIYHPQKIVKKIPR